MAPRVFERGAVLVICWLACPTVSHAPNLARPSIWAGRAPRAIYLKAGASDGANAEVADATVVPPPLALRPIQRFLSTDLGRPTRVARFVGSLLLLWTWPWVLDAVRIRLTGGTAYANMFGAQLRLVRKMSFRLLVASACGSVMGLERKSADRPAGLRSMTLVSVGSCLYTLAVIYGTHGGDPGRAAAQVCTGVGFIGAGVIWKGSDIKSPVRGVTTACAVWVSAALGVVAASGLWLFALYACGLSVTVLRVSRWYNLIIGSNTIETTEVKAASAGERGGGEPGGSDATEMRSNEHDED